MYKIYNEDNNTLLFKLNEENILFDVIYGDPIYESFDFHWVRACYELLKYNGIFFVQTDYHTAAEYKIYLDILFGKENFINWLIVLQEWGGTSKRFFPRKHDDILMYAKGKDYKFYPERIQIPKITAGSSFDKKGTGQKTPCDVFCDLGNFSTTAKERVKGIDGKNIRWQKPQKLYERILRICTDSNDEILDPYMGSGSLGVYCNRNNLNYFGIEKDLEIFKIAKRNIELNSHI
jgi:site-specific DNA-methyltransferase (adenine-specific)